MPVMRFTQRLTGYFNVSVKTLIKTGTTNIVDITNNNWGVATIGPLFAREVFNTTGSLKRYVSPFRLLNIPVAHSTARVILTSSRFPVDSVFVL
jgi:hypothetical protein